MVLHIFYNFQFVYVLWMELNNMQEFISSYQIASLLLILRMSMIYALVARDKMVLADYSAYSGNFTTTAMDVLQRTKVSKMFGQYVTAYHTFYTYIKDGFLFLVMVESAYETRIAVSFLKQIQESFFAKFDSKRRNKAIGYELKEFSPILQEWIRKYSNRAEVDKLYNLRKELTELEEQSLINMDKIIERGEKIENLVKKSENLANLSHDVAVTAKAVKNQMWWKRKKALIGIVTTVLIVVTVIVLVIVL